MEKGKHSNRVISDDALLKMRETVLILLLLILETHGIRFHRDQHYKPKPESLTEPLNVGTRWTVKGLLSFTTAEIATVHTWVEFFISSGSLACSRGIDLLRCYPFRYEVPENITNVCFCNKHRGFPVHGVWTITIRGEADPWQSKGTITARFHNVGEGIHSTKDIWKLPEIIIFHVPECKQPWKAYFDKWRKQKYCYKTVSSPPRTFSNASDFCNRIYNSKLATPHGKYNNGGMFFSHANVESWIGVIQDRNLDNMLMYNDGVPMDTSWITWTPWDTGQPRSNLHCTTITNGRWKSRSCTEKFPFICEFQICAGEGWKYNPYSDRCIKRVNTPMTFDNASETCSQQGAIIESPRSRHVELLLLYFGGPAELWLGMMNVEDGIPGRWHDGAPVTWTGWKGSQNNNFQSRYGPYVCMRLAPTAGGSESAWYKSACKPNKYRFVCGKITCRFPYQSVTHTDFTPFYPKCYRCLVNERLNARQAGQFCSEDGVNSNPAKLSAPNNPIEHDILQATDIGCSGTKWMGFAFNAALSKWQWNDFTIDGELENGWTGWRDHYKPRNRARAGYACAADYHWAPHWSAVRCSTQLGFACEKQQPYVLSGCDKTLPNAKLFPVYYPQVPPSQRMQCHYYHTTEISMSFAENDRFCASLGGYLIMPKTQFQLIDTFRIVYSHSSYWIGADNIGHCYNKREWCADNINTYTFLDGSPVTFTRRVSKLNNLNHSENCLAVEFDGDVNSYAFIDVPCTSQRKGVCQVMNNNHRAHRNWDFLTACKPNYKAGAPTWYAAPGDLCYGTPALVEFLLPWIRECSKFDACTAKPLNKEQTRSLVLSRPRLVNDSWIGVYGFKWFHNVSGEGEQFFLLDAKIPSSEWNWEPGIPDLTDYWPKYPDHLLCNSMGLNGKWLRGNCYDKRPGSCEKPAVASLSMWRAARTANLASDQASARTAMADRVNVGYSSCAIAIIIIITTLCVY